MTPSELPDAHALMERIKGAMDEAHEAWAADRESAGRGSAKVATRALKRRIWEIGLEFARVYPSAVGLGDDATAYAAEALKERGAHLWPRGQEHSPLKEWLYDVAWAEFDGEYTDFSHDRDTSQHVPAFKRLVLALESEFLGRWEVLLDFNKLLAARADIRVMVWDADAIDDGFKLLESRLRAADGWDDGYWLLSGWGGGGFEHVEYHNGQKQD